MIYFIQNTDNSLIKIGFTNSLQQRIVTLGAEVGSPIILLACMNGSVLDEHGLHEQFNDERVDGEWFRPTERLMNFIASVGIDAANKDMERMQRDLVRLKKIILEKGLTQKRIADATGISATHLSHIFNGHKPTILDDAQRIAREVGMTVDELWPLPEKEE